MTIIKIGNVELTEKEAEEALGKYIVTYRKIYEVRYSVNGGYYGTIVYTYPEKECGLTRRGRYYVMDAATVNHILGFKLLNE